MGKGHIQDFDSATQLESHWGYADRVIPCVNDAGSCEYLDLVYGSHDRGMVYTGVFWLTVAFVLMCFAINRYISLSRALPLDSPAEAQLPMSGFLRVKTAVQSYLRRYLLPNNPLRFVFGYVTRYQVAVFGLFLVYMTIWSFVGLIYKKWKTPVKGEVDMYNTRSTLGPWANRVGVLAYALTPLSILLASRESFLSYATGIPYTSFLFLHRWVGYLIVLQSMLHTMGWIMVEAWLYKPQPEVWDTFVPQLYVKWGFVGLGLLTLIWFLSLPWAIRNITGYEFFRKAHYVMAMVYIGALIGHWKNLQCFLTPGICLWAIDRALRVVRPFQLHDRGNTWGIIPAQASVKLWKDDVNGDIYRLDFDIKQKSWKVGQHFFLCFPQSGWWQSHPFTPISAPPTTADAKSSPQGMTQSYVIRAKGGETKKIAALAESRLASDPKSTLSVIITGAYGENITESFTPQSNILCVAGGTGIAYVLPPLIQLARASNISSDRKIELIWVVRRKLDIEWIQPELETLLAPVSAKIVVKMFVTTETASDHGDAKVSANPEKQVSSDSNSSLNSETPYAIGWGRPELVATVREFVDTTIKGETTVVASGPLGMVSDLRRAVAVCNDGSKVWKGEERFSVRLVCDERLEG
ncbi:hypothetical protein Cpir12675_006630 [Ceratocystis pirilliformis]|uniref:ferric-chelate reductase (NADPH) n=1 Tax=Ceratocystis pirilliformis TaxID=259994 RepID=A0ABR3YHD7_9PEZI